MMNTDTILINGTVLTMDEALPRAEAVAIRGNQIMAVGATGEIERLASTDTERIDLGGRTVIPGFIDAHVHFLNMGLKLMEVNLRGAASIEGALERMRQRGREVGRGAWVVGNRWDESKWIERRYLTRSDLDRALPDNPAVARRICEHLWVANNKVLALAAIPTNQLEFDAAFEEKIKGTINPGMVADLAMLSADATAIDVDGIRDIEVEMTMIDGKVWYVKCDV